MTTVAKRTRVEMEPQTQSLVLQIPPSLQGEVYSWLPCEGLAIARTVCKVTLKTWTLDTWVIKNKSLEFSGKISRKLKWLSTVSNFPTITTLSLFRIRTSDYETALGQLAKKLPNLREIFARSRDCRTLLENCPNSKDVVKVKEMSSTVGKSKLPTTYPHIQFIDCTATRVYSQTQLENALINCDRKELILQGFEILPFKKHSALQSVHLLEASMTLGVLKSLLEIPSLKILTIDRSSPDFSSEELASPLNSSTFLHELDLYNLTLPLSHFQKMISISGLRRLVIGCVENDELNTPQDEWISALNRADALRSLEIREDMGKTFLNHRFHLLKHPELREFNIKYYSRDDLFQREHFPSIIEMVRNCPNLHRFKVVAICDDSDSFKPMMNDLKAALSKVRASLKFSYHTD
jgi:hypothetical protein